MPITEKQAQKAKIKLGYDPKGIDAHILLSPIKDSGATGVAIKVGTKTIRTQLCPTKQDVIRFITEAL